MQAFVLTLHIIACLFLISVVLLQSGKEGMGVIFGGGSSSVFGSGGAGGLLTKLTAMFAAIFLVTSLLYNVLSSSSVESESRILDVEVQEQAPAIDLPADGGIQIEEGGEMIPVPGIETQTNPGEVFIEENAPAESQ